ncbi:unnamed protein product [Penicillium olsonii]|nr:unnamed protein product [Penicillium olsonii]
MPARRNSPVTAEGFLHDLSAQMEHFLRFLEVDLTPAITQTGATSDYQSVVDFISQGASSRLWILRLQTIFRWSSLALEEEEWLRTQGLDRAITGSHVRGVWSMPTFLRHLGRSNDHNACSDLQRGRKLRRFEIEFGEGIALLLTPVLPTFRRLSLGEEARAMQLLKASHTEILSHAERLLASKSKYQTLLPCPILPMH